jgi:hypothetical protein
MANENAGEAANQLEAASLQNRAVMFRIAGAAGSSVYFYVCAVTAGLRRGWGFAGAFGIPGGLGSFGITTTLTGRRLGHPKVTRASSKEAEAEGKPGEESGKE